MTSHISTISKSATTFPPSPAWTRPISRPPALDPRSRRARAQHQENGRLRQGSRHAPPGAWQDAQVGRRAEAARWSWAAPVGVCCQKVSEAEVFVRAVVSPKCWFLTRFATRHKRSNVWRSLPKLGARKYHRLRRRPGQCLPTSRRRRSRPRARELECLCRDRLRRRALRRDQHRGRSGRDRPGRCRPPTT